MENIINDTIVQPIGMTTENEERINIRAFKSECNIHLETLSADFLTINGLFTMLENVMTEDETVGFSTCEVMKLLREEIDDIQETVENFIYPEELEEGELESLENLKKEFKRTLKIIFDDTMNINAVASVLAEAIGKETEEIKIIYLLSVRLAVKRLNDIIEKIAVLLKD